jgi:hypothetical protein
MRTTVLKMETVNSASRVPARLAEQAISEPVRFFGSRHIFLNKLNTDGLADPILPNGTHHRRLNTLYGRILSGNRPNGAAEADNTLFLQRFLRKITLFGILLGDCHPSRPENGIP